MNAADYYNHVINADRNRALMARILLNTTEGGDFCGVDLVELRQLSQLNRIATEAFLDRFHWNPPIDFHCGEQIVAIAES